MIFVVFVICIVFRSWKMVESLWQLRTRIPLRWNQQLRRMEIGNKWLFQIHNPNGMSVLAVKSGKSTKLQTKLFMQLLTLAKRGQNVAVDDWSIMTSQMTNQHAPRNQMMSRQNGEQEEERAKKHQNESLVKHLGCQKLQWTGGMLYPVYTMKQTLKQTYSIYTCTTCSKFASC